MEAKVNTTNAATSFLRAHEQYRREIRTKSFEKNQDIMNAYMSALNAVISYQARIQGRKYQSQDAVLMGRMGLIAQFIQGIPITETAISEGLYAQAGNLLKQQLETLAALEEYESGKRRDGKTPQVRGRLSSFGRLYGDFNEAAHPAKAAIVNSLATWERGHTTIPQFRQKLFETLFAYHALFVSMLLAYMRPIFIEGFNVDWDSDEEAKASICIKTVAALGVISIHPKVP